jgi:hypothetical protein
MIEIAESKHTKRAETTKNCENSTTQRIKEIQKAVNLRVGAKVVMLLSKAQEYACPFNPSQLPMCHSGDSGQASVLLPTGKRARLYHHLE